jgi:putative restriction endonuclease
MKGILLSPLAARRNICEAVARTGAEGQAVARAVFYHKPNSGYDDRIDRHYHFPKQYLERVTAAKGDAIVYYGPIKGLPGRYYSATAMVSDIRPDLSRKDHYYADVVRFIEFDRPVPYLEGGGYERRLILPDGRISGGQAVNAVRLLDDAEFAAILEAGLSQPDDWPDRDDGNEANIGNQFGEGGQELISRPVVQLILNRAFRERKFKLHVRRAYRRTCAFTGLCLTNGGGRPEVQAAHIVPVSEGGSDSIRNGIALSGTVHWMFDRGLLSLQDDYKILLSRKLNHDISHLLNANRTAIVPDDPRLRPHPECLKWHRQKWDFQ